MKYLTIFVVTGEGGLVATSPERRRGRDKRGEVGAAVDDMKHMLK